MGRHLAFRGSLANPRIDDLRKRMEREPGSRLFAQLAEELRRDGALVDAIRVCRDGLQRHPTYWSARLTLGRCLADSGDKRGAVEELGSVFQASPDNLLAGKLLAECQEALEEFPAAAETYAALVRLAPGDKQLVERLAAVRERAARSAPRAQTSSGDMENRFAPIPLVEVDEDAFELERPGEAGVFSRPEAPAPAPEAVRPAPAPEPAAHVVPAAPSEEMVFEFDGEGERGGSTASFEPVFRALDTPVESPAAFEPQVAATPGLPTTLPGIMLTDVASPALASPTLAELYHEQGATDRAIETYQEVLRREPDNAKARLRLAELQKSAQAAPPSRRAVIERTIARLEAFSAALQRG